MQQLSQSLNEATTKLSASEEQKKAFENEIRSLNESMAEMRNDLEQRSTKLNELESQIATKVIYHKFKLNYVLLFPSFLSQSSQMEQLSQSLNEAIGKLSAAEEQKKTFENEIRSLHESMAEMRNDLEQRSTKLNELESESSTKVI